MWSFTSLSPDETFHLGVRMGHCLEQGSVVALNGDLGAGKTLLVKGLAHGFAQIETKEVQSPTFVHLNIYSRERSVYHFDLYRLRDAESFLSMGFEEYFFSEGLCCIEWPERIRAILPPQTVSVTLTHIGEGKRRLDIPLPQAARLWKRQEHG